MSKVLILGVGNILQSDDGLGVYIVNHITESGIKIPDNIDVVDGGTAGFDLLPLMRGYSKIIIVDALKTDDVPGSVYRFTPEHLIEKPDGYSLHEVGVKKILRMLKLMGDDPDIEIIGVVPENIDTLNIGISDSVKQSIPKVVDQIFDAAIQ